MRIKHLINERGDLETLAGRLVVVFVSITSYNYEFLNPSSVFARCGGLRLYGAEIVLIMRTDRLCLRYSPCSDCFLANILLSKVCGRFTYSTGELSDHVVFGLLVHHLLYVATRGCRI